MESDQAQEVQAAAPTEAGDSSAEAQAVPSGTSEQQAATPGEVTARAADFAQLADNNNQAGNLAVDRFLDVQVDVWAELGRSIVPIGDLMQLGEGAVLKLNRSISEPVDLVAQGVRVARGEVVVVDDCFAVRIKEIEAA